MTTTVSRKEGGGESERAEKKESTREREGTRGACVNRGGAGDSDCLMRRAPAPQSWV